MSEILSKEEVEALRLSYDFVPHSGFFDRHNSKDVRALIRTNEALNDALVLVERALDLCEYSPEATKEECAKALRDALAAVAKVKPFGWCEGMSFENPLPHDELLSNMPRRCSHCMQWIASKQEGIGMCAFLTKKLPHTFGCTEWKPTKNRKANRYSEGAR